MPEHTRQLTTTDGRRAGGRTYWASFEHLADSPEVADLLSKEFPTYDPDDVLHPSRRRFLKYAAASMMLAGVGLSGCRRWPREVLAPYAHKPKERIEGVPEYYATSWELGGVGQGLLVSSFDGRPFKIEGNPSHPSCVTRSGEWGATEPVAQAQTLALYDPDRSRQVIDRTGGNVRGQSVQWFRDTVVPALRQANPGRMAVLCEATASPTVVRLRRQFEQQFAGARWYTWEPLAATSQAQATQAAAGQRLRPVYHLDKAQVVVSIDEDYLGQHPNRLRNAADWSTLRASADAEHPAMSRCYVAECRYSLTGASGDYRLPVKPSRLADLTMALAGAMGIAGVRVPQLDDQRERDWVEKAAHDLHAAGANGLLAWGWHLPAGLQVLCMQINQALGGVGNTLTYVADPTPEAGTIQELAQRMDGGEIETLLILGGNPAYDAPADLGFGALLGKVATSVHLSLYDDETSALCTFHVPRAHFLEAWGDTRGWDGTVAPIQPLILPLFNGLSSIELLALLLNLPATDGRSLVRETISGLLGAAASAGGQGRAGEQRDQADNTQVASESAEGDKPFRAVLHDGVVPGTALPPVAVSIQPGAGDRLPMTPEAQGAGGLELVFAGDGRMFDGRFANNGWLQEVPETLTKLTWDNAALMNIRDAEDLGVRTMDVVELELGGRKLGLPVYVMPGQPQGVVGLVLGFGRTRAGSIGTVRQGEGGGFDTYALRTTGGLWYAPGASARPQGQRYLLAMTQNHHLIDQVGYEGRQKRVGDKGETAPVFRETTFAEHAAFLAGQHAAGGGGHGVGGGGHGGGHGNGYPGNRHQHGAVSLQIFEPPAVFNHPHAWGMTIDTNTCIGCGACVVACSAENNIPVVGKEQVLNNREMMWLRIDRYFKSEGEDYETQIHDDNPDVALQPMMCVHCENAPCEQVCPVAATTHDTEGLNVMVYNRCIGTRYCSNNCPYKVRKFNYLDWWVKDPRGSMLTAVWPGMPDGQQQEIDAIKRMVFNPDVTVRMRGVMEKCTYCTQRIKYKTIWRGNRGEEVRDGDVKTACQMACPTESIVFGNLLDAQARVARQQKLPRAYGVLEDLNTRPRTKYLAKLRNREPAAAAAAGGGGH